MKKTKARPKIPTIVNTKPEATLFCRKDVLELASATEAALEDGSTTVVVLVTEGGVKGTELLPIEGVVKAGGAAEEMVEETLLDKLDGADDEAELDCDDELVPELVRIRVLVALFIGRIERGSESPIKSLGRKRSKA